MELRELDATLKSEDGRHAAGRLRLASWTPRERLRRALKLGGAAWGLALLGIPFPIIHLTAVPLLLVAGPFLALWVYGQEGQVAGGEGTCPACAKPFRIEKGAPRFPLRDLCTECGARVTIEPAIRTPLRAR